MAYKRRGGWGGRRNGSGAKPKLVVDNASAKAPAQPAQAASRYDLNRLMEMVEASQAAAKKRPRTLDWCPYRIEGKTPLRFLHPAAAMPPREQRMAFDQDLVSQNGWAQNQWLAGGLLGAVESEGLFFLGYPVLSEMSQRSEFYTISDTIATEMIRKGWVWKGTGQRDEERRDEGDDKAAARLAAKKKPNGPASRATKLGDDDKSGRIRDLRDFERHLQLADRFGEAALSDNLMGRSHFWLEGGKNVTDEELKTPLVPLDADAKIIREVLSAKIGPGWLRRVANVEAMWVYPLSYNTNNPLSADWYTPQEWYVFGRGVHRSRMPTFIGRPVRDMLKPAYSFGGLSLSQMIKPYIDIWIRTRQSVADLVDSYATMGLFTDLSTMLSPDGGGAASLIARVTAASVMRDNQGWFVANKDTEDLKSVSHPIAGLGELQQQALEHVMIPARIPRVKFAGLQPTGLNASSEGELQVWDETIGSYQNKLFAPKLDYVGWIMMLSLWGEIDEDIVHEFVPLQSLTEKEEAEIDKFHAETAQLRIDSGVISQEEERQRLADDPKSPYPDIDPEDVPDLLEEEAEGLEPEGGKPQPIA